VTTLVGLLAAAMTTGAWFPQLWRTWRTRSAQDLSWAYLATTAIGMGTWLIYGLLAGDGVVIAANVTTVVLLSALVVLKARRRPRLVVLPELEELSSVP